MPAPPRVSLQDCLILFAGAVYRLRPPAEPPVHVAQALAAESMAGAPVAARHHPAVGWLVLRLTNVGPLIAWHDCTSLELAKGVIEHLNLDSEIQGPGGAGE